MKKIVLICSLLILSSYVLAQKYDKVQVEATDLGNGVYMLTGAGGNIGVCAGEDGVFIVDDQYAPLHGKIIAAIKEIQDTPIRFVINTHWHRDHTGGNELMGNKGSVIIAHDNVRKTMAAPQIIKYFKSLSPASPKAALPIVTFNDSLTLHLNNSKVQALHVANAHTDGDSIVHFKKANVIHMGDTFFKGRYPFIDADHGGSITGIIEAANTALKIADENTQIIPGHGTVATKQDLMDYKNALSVVKSRLKKLVKEKLSLQEILEKDCLVDLNKTWGQGFMKPALFTEIVVDTLVREVALEKEQKKDGRK